MVKNDNGVLIEKDTSMEGDHYNTRATAILNTSPEILSQKIEKVSQYPTWLYKYHKAEIIETTPNGFIFRAIINAPIPLKDRKIQIQITQSTNNGTQFYHMKGMAISDPKFCEDCVEMSKINGLWEIKKISDTQTQLRNTINLEVSVPLPRSILYPLTYRAPLKTFQMLIEEYNTKTIE